MIYPITETFVSPQGEGEHCGRLMQFIRFAGCNVGKPYTNEEKEQQWLSGLVLAPYQEKCQTHLGSSFSCDTNYVMAKKMTEVEIAQECKGTFRVCLTGGEPLLHDLAPLIDLLRKQGCDVHIETSGTKSIATLKNSYPHLWIAVSPKVGCLPSSLTFADEIKVLVGHGFQELEFARIYSNHFSKVWLQPINWEHTINQSNMNLCLDLQKRYPQCRISSQAHKLWHVR